MDFGDLFRILIGAARPLVPSHESVGVSTHSNDVVRDPVG